MRQNTVWREVVGIAVLIFFAVSGAGHLLFPDRFMKPWHRGGEMLTESNRFQIRIFGAILMGFAIYTFYNILRG